jgi:hypothetical protein
MPKLTAALKRSCRRARQVPGLIERVIAAVPTVLPKYGLTSDLTICHAMAQFSEEWAAENEMQENVNYLAARLGVRNAFQFIRKGRDGASAAADQYPIECGAPPPNDNALLTPRLACNIASAHFSDLRLETPRSFPAR